MYRSAELLAHPKLGIALRASDLNPIVTGLRGLLGSTRGTLSSTERQVISEAVDALNSAEGMHELISLSGRSADDMVLS